MRAVLKNAAKSAAVYLLTNKKARALEWALAVGVYEAIRASLGSA